jgi:hypothetical protein
MRSHVWPNACNFVGGDIAEVRSNDGRVMYAKQFFDLQLEFAERVSALSAQIPEAKAGTVCKR